MERQYDTPAGDPDPQITVVLCTYNRADRVEGAVRAILAQEGCDFELVVVDDGSTDATPAVLAAIDDDRLSGGSPSERRPLGRAQLRTSPRRGAGGSSSSTTTTWPSPGGWRTFLEQTTDPDRRHRLLRRDVRQRDGDVLCEHRPAPFGEPYGPVVGSSLAGTFAVAHRSRPRGGRLPRRPRDAPSERAVHPAALGRRPRRSPPDERRCPAGAHRGPLGHRPARREPAPVVRRHALDPRPASETFAGQRNVIARFEGIVGTNAARLGDWRAARRRLLPVAPDRRPGRHRDGGGWRSPACPAAGRRVWNRHGVWSTHDADEVGRARPGHRGQGRPRPGSCSWPGGTRRTPPRPTAPAPPRRRFGRSR